MFWRRARVTGQQTSSRKAKWLLLLASTVFALLFAEVLLRCSWKNPYQYDGPDRVVRLRMQHANTWHRHDRSSIDPEEPTVVLRTDARSYILPSFQHDKPDCTIAFVGGSTTECCAVTESLRFPALVSTELAKRDLRVNTLNAGTSGNTVHDSINILMNHVVEDKPDIVVLMHACNDIGVLAEAGDYTSRSGKFFGWPSVVRSALMNITNHCWLAAILRVNLKEHTRFEPVAPTDLRPSGSSLQQTELLAQFEQRLRAFIRTCRAFDIEPVVMTQPTAGYFTELTPAWADQHAQDLFNESIRRIGTEEQATVIDLVGHLRSNVTDWDQHMNVFYDGVHVTDKGSVIYGEYITQQLEPRVREIVARPYSESEQEILTSRPLERR